MCSIPPHWHSSVMKQSVCAALPCLHRLASLCGCIHCHFTLYIKSICSFQKGLRAFSSLNTPSYIKLIHYKQCYHDALFSLSCPTLFAVWPLVSLTDGSLLSLLCWFFADPGRSVMSARFRLPAGRSYNVRATELERDKQHTQVVCNVLLLDNTVQAFKVSVSTALPVPSLCPTLIFSLHKLN